MKKSNRMWVLSTVMFVLLFVAAVFWMSNKPDSKPAPTASPGLYYTGPMRNKSNRDVWATEDGRRVPPPPGADTTPSGSTQARLTGPVAP